MDDGWDDWGAFGAAEPPVPVQQTTNADDEWDFGGFDGEAVTTPVDQSADFSFNVVAVDDGFNDDKTDEKRSVSDGDSASDTKDDTDGDSDDHDGVEIEDVTHEDDSFSQHRDFDDESRWLPATSEHVIESVELDESLAAPGANTSEIFGRCSSENGDNGQNEVYNDTVSNSDDKVQSDAFVSEVEEPIVDATVPADEAAPFSAEFSEESVSDPSIEAPLDKSLEFSTEFTADAPSVEERASETVEEHASLAVDDLSFDVIDEQSSETVEEQSNEAADEPFHEAADEPSHGTLEGQSSETGEEQSNETDEEQSSEQSNEVFEVASIEAAEEIPSDVVEALPQDNIDEASAETVSESASNVTPEPVEPVETVATAAASPFELEVSQSAENANFGVSGDFESAETHETSSKDDFDPFAALLSSEETSHASSDVFSGDFFFATSESSPATVSDAALERSSDSVDPIISQQTDSPVGDSNSDDTNDVVSDTNNLADDANNVVDDTNSLVYENNLVDGSSDLVADTNSLVGDQEIARGRASESEEAHRSEEADQSEKQSEIDQSEKQSEIDQSEIDQKKIDQNEASQSETNQSETTQSETQQSEVSQGEAKQDETAAVEDDWGFDEHTASAAQVEPSSNKADGDDWGFDDSANVSAVAVAVAASEVAPGNNDNDDDWGFDESVDATAAPETVEKTAETVTTSAGTDEINNEDDWGFNSAQVELTQSETVQVETTQVETAVEDDWGFDTAEVVDAPVDVQIAAATGGDDWSAFDQAQPSASHSKEWPPSSDRNNVGNDDRTVTDWRSLLSQVETLSDESVEEPCIDRLLHSLTLSCSREKPDAHALAERLLKRSISARSLPPQRRRTCHEKPRLPRGRVQPSGQPNSQPSGHQITVTPVDVNTATAVQMSQADFSLLDALTADVPTPPPEKTSADDRPSNVIVVDSTPPHSDETSELEAVSQLRRLIDRLPDLSWLAS
ncbi:MAG: hypothetical protein MHM6MM_004839 [Cercozoa sp. M6MM]